MAITQSITVLPTPPSMADPDNFDPRADAFLGALPTMQTQMNTWAGQANTTAAEIGIVTEGLLSVTPGANKVPQADGDGELALGWLDLSGYAPAANGVTNGDSHDHSGGDGAQIAYANLSGLPTLGTAAATASTDYAPSAQGVTNGNSHDHNGGDGAQIAYANLSGLPTLGTAAATASTDYAPAAKGVTNGDSHDHSGGDGAQIAYANLSGLPTLGTAAATAATDYVAESFLDFQVGFRNVIVNGDFFVWGLGTSGFSSYGRCADTWMFGWGGTSPSPERGTGYNQFRYGLSWTGAAGNTFAHLLTNIEATPCRRFMGAANTLTLSGYFYGSESGSIFVEINTADAINNFSSVTSRASTTVTLDAAGWTYFTLSYSAPTDDVANGIQVSFYQTNCTSGTWTITGVQLEQGNATPFEYKPAGMEGLLCKRYFRTGDFYVPATTAQNLGIIDMFKTPTITGGGAGFTSTGTTRDNLIAYQTTGGVQKLQLEAYP